VRGRGARADRGGDAGWRDGRAGKGDRGAARAGAVGLGRALSRASGVAAAALDSFLTKHFVRPLSG